MIRRRSRTSQQDEFVVPQHRAGQDVTDASFRQVDDLCEHDSRSEGFFGAQVGSHSLVQAGVPVTKAPEKLRAGRAVDAMDLDALVKHTGYHGKGVGQWQRRRGGKPSDRIGIELESPGAASERTDQEIKQGRVARGKHVPGGRGAHIHTRQQR